MLLVESKICKAETYIKYRKTNKKFIENAKKLEGGPRGVKKRGILTAIKSMNNYFNLIDGISLYNISQDLGIPPWKAGAMLVKIGVLVYNKYGTRFFEYCDEKGVKSDEEHLRLVDAFFEDLYNGK
jgi:DNA polymerase I-like protein with 3'-5' exonuclease and polymerase domains